MTSFEKLLEPLTEVVVLPTLPKELGDARHLGCLGVQFANLSVRAFDRRVCFTGIGCLSERPHQSAGPLGMARTKATVVREFSNSSPS